MQTCPRCEASRDGGRFCSGCGFDFWRAAAGDEQAHVEEAATPQPVQARRERTGAALVAAGLGLLVLAGVAAFLLVSGDDLRPGETAGTRRPLTEQEEVIYAFFREARDPHAAFSLVEECSLALSGENSLLSDWSASGLIHGDDWYATMETTAGPEAGLRVDAAFVAGTTYYRLADQEWQSAELPRSWLGPVSPFAWIASVAELEYVRREQGGRTLHVLMTDKWMPIEIDSVLHAPVANLSDRESRMEIVVDADGIPVSAVHTLSAIDRAGSGAIQASCEYSFSDWDAVEPIQAPVPGATPAPDDGQPMAAPPAVRG